MSLCNLDSGRRATIWHEVPPGTLWVAHVRVGSPRNQVVGRRVRVGMDAFRGIGLILSRPRLWPLCFLPVGVALSVYILLVWLAMNWLRTQRGSEIFLGLVGLAIVVGLALLSVVVMSAFIGVIFDPLSREVERELSGEAPPAVPFTWRQLFADSLQRFGYNILLGILAFAIGFVPVVGAIFAVMVTGVIGLLDYTSVAYLRRGKPFGVQRKELFRTLDRPAILFGAIVGLSALIPGLGLILAPGFIAGGTILARRKLATAG